MPTVEPKTIQNRIHLDLTTRSLPNQLAFVDRAIELGATHVDIGQRPDEPHVVLGDPEGNEFCVIEPGNRFLANTDLIGAVNCDGTKALGHFWSAALEWPLVWDQNEETAIQSPKGGSKVTWSGPPLMPLSGRDRLRLVVSSDPGHAAVEIRRLVALGATLSRTQGSGRTTLLDPDGNEIVLAPLAATDAMSGQTDQWWSRACRMMMWSSVT